jgi:hypothetical protein
MMVPTNPPITGTIIYTAADQELLRTRFGRSRPLQLWQSTLAAGGLGAIIGNGVSALTPWFSTGGAWFALAGAIALSTAWSWRVMGAAVPPAVRPQTVTLTAEGLRLTTPKADTLMRWPLFTRRHAAADHIALLTEDETWVLLRPSHFATAADYAAAVALIEANVT